MNNVLQGDCQVQGHFHLANGAKTDQKTLQEFNQTLATDRANLETKKNEANAEEQDLRDLCTTLRHHRPLL
jgi:hypothetical protein